VNIENNMKFENALKKKTRRWAESDPRPRRSWASGPLSSLGQNDRGGLLGWLSESTLMVSQARTDQLRRIRWRTGQGRGYIRMTR
jgi:hypothetical protein